MLLHEAADQLSVMQSKLDEVSTSKDVWTVHYQKEVGYYLWLNFELKPYFAKTVGFCSDDIKEEFAYYDEMEKKQYITLQRGGVRYFKTLDAVVAALHKIGQRSITIPTGV